MRLNDIDYNIDWRKFKLGWSVFLPCLRVEEGKVSVNATMKRLDFKVAIKPVIEDGIKGLRIWRIG